MTELRYNIHNRPWTVSYPSIALKVAAWFWRENAYAVLDLAPSKKTNLNELCDGTYLSFTQLTHSLTNHIKALKERAIINENTLEAFKQSAMKRGQVLHVN